MRGVKRVRLIGNPGNDPGNHWLEENMAAAKFPPDINDTYKYKTSELVSLTECRTVVLWRGLAQMDLCII